MATGTIPNSIDPALASASRILLVRLSALGDAVHTLPLLDALRRARPEARIVWLVEQGAASLLRDHPQLDRVVLFPRRELVERLRGGRLVAAARLLVGLARTLRAERFDLAIDVQCNLRSSALARLSGAPRRIGFAPPYTKEKSHWLTTDRVRPRVHRQLKVQRNLDLLGPLGIDVSGARARVHVSDAARSRAEACFASLGSGPFVALHPGVSGFGAFKAWPPERYGALARRLHEDLGARAFVTWGPGERDLAEAIVRDAAGPACLAPETASILDLAALYERCDAVVGSDTGPVHLAAALGAPVVGLYGPKDPAIYAPWSARTGEAATTVWKRVHCSPCTLRRCGNVICMPAISVDDVADSVRRELSERGGPEALRRRGRQGRVRGRTMTRSKHPEPLDLRPARSLPLGERANKCEISGFRDPAPAEASAAELLDSLPDFLGARSLRELAACIAASHRRGRHVIAALGGHVVKVGCGPVLIDLMERGIVTALSVNGAFVIHDYEIALQGATSEYVDETIRDGSFGWAREPADAFARACARGAEEGIGLGRAMALETEKLPQARQSVLAACARLGVPITVHVGIGTDTVHMHPGLSGAALGEASHIDFRIAARIATELEGGVWLNVGSAVVMPEVFLKLVSIARNLGHALGDVVAANLDMQRHYRTDANVIGRPVARGIEVLGHHEINLPLLRQAILLAQRAPASDVEVRE